jgi:hypothetical protein
MPTVHVNADRYRDLVPPDGPKLDVIRVGQLYNILVTLPTMPKQELLGRYESALICRAEAKARAET